MRSRSFLRGTMLIVLLVATAGFGLPLAPAFAHPMGNFTISHYTEITARPDGFAFLYILDLAEIPAFEELRQRDESEAKRHLTARLGEWLQALELYAGTESVPLALVAARISCPPGVGGLPTLRVESDLWADFPAISSGERTVEVFYRDRNFPQRTGWKEIVVTGAHVRSSSVPANDRGSERLRIYPSRYANLPPNELEARFSVLADGNRRAKSRYGIRPSPRGITFDLTGCYRTQTTVPGLSRLSGQIEGFLTLGIRHILTGYDHMLFLLCLLMLGGGMSYLLKVVTAFTVAHSVTLSLAALNLVTLPGRLVESAIALSIVYVAIENLWRQKVNLRSRWTIAFGFGLVHGVGFASILREIAIPRSSLAVSLVSFNLGVEVGQVLTVVLAYGLLHVIRRWRWASRMRQWASVGAAVTGLVWFVQRAFLGI